MSLKDDYLDADQAKLLNAIKTTCFDPLKKDVKELKTGQAELKKELGEVKQSLNNHLSQDHETINKKLDKLLKK